MTGAVASQIVTEACKVSSERPKCCRVQWHKLAWLETDKSSRDEIGHSDPVVLRGPSPTDKRYAGDNRLILLKSSYRRQCLHPMSAHHILGLSRSQGFGCSPIKVVRELGSERRGQFGSYLLCV